MHSAGDGVECIEEVAHSEAVHTTEHYDSAEMEEDDMKCKINGKK